jgi:hypothetical protein
VSQPAEINREVVEAALRAIGGAREQAWDSRSEDAKDAYVQRLRQGADEPSELTVLLAGQDAADRWAGVPWLLRAEYAAWIKSGRTRFTRRRRAAFALRNAPADLS